MILVSVVVPVFNKVQLLRQSLDSIVAAAQADGNTELIFVDHGSTDGTYELLQTYGGVASVHQIREGTIASVRNEGARRARGDILSFIDCDCVVPRTYVRDLRDVFASTGAAAAGCECDIPRPAHWTERTWHRLHALTKDGVCHYLNSANFAVRRDVFDAIGGFDEHLLTGEDTDICCRIRARGVGEGAGHDIFEAQRLRVIHLANPKSVRQFFHKQRWHGASVLRGTSSLLRNRMTLMVCAHAVGVIAAVAVLVAPLSMDATARALLAAGLVLWIPVATVAYRYVETRRFSNPVSAVFLYTVFYFARATSLVTSIGRVLKRPAKSFRLLTIR